MNSLVNFSKTTNYFLPFHINLLFLHKHISIINTIIPSLHLEINAASPLPPPVAEASGSRMCG